jgi:hypothetical protein
MIYRFGDTEKDISYKLRIAINDIAKGLGASALDSSESALDSIAGKLFLGTQTFPCPDGKFASASPFKKAGYLYAAFAESKPLFAMNFLNPQANFIPKEIQGLPYLNAIFGLALAARSLNGATLRRKQENKIEVLMLRPLAMSKHYWQDFVSAFSIVQLSDWQKISLVFEALSYNTNPSASYPRRITF